MSAGPTAKALRREVEEWRDRLFYLGIGHFDAKVHIVEETQSEEPSYATAHIHDQFDEVEIEFTHAFLALPKDRRAQIIAHEWIHVAMRDLDRHVETVEHWMPAGAYKDYEARLAHEREGLVDRLARTVYDIHTKKVVG